MSKLLSTVQVLAFPYSQNNRLLSQALSPSSAHVVRRGTQPCVCMGSWGQSLHASKANVHEGMQHACSCVHMCVCVCLVGIAYRMFKFMTS